MLYLMYRLCIVTLKLALSFIFVRSQRLEIPLYIKPVDGISEPCLQSLVRLPDILCQEEDDLYHNAKETCGSDIVAAIHNGSGGYSHGLPVCSIVCYIPIIYTLSQKDPSFWSPIISEDF